ncbi:Zinc finger protein [Wickerhamomyces ciferrii]|uniref:Zinc finger protein n=1 Tax=Wickerhamomyces ciferrii (strain ATCC 14091 / BCRC 22168 / CBS 111 / JCM 3599 / NBRC 0793 / NRRL Y-1031 F-60-10) TaxID=1206466 RepID=K0KYL7_WICCF|nr:Zinc finger protein [Wickerhamomyces ciferrii]CCH46173.1 Zinc finger protein [Wickerhamomyces ciferrii]
MDDDELYQHAMGPIELQHQQYHQQHQLQHGNSFYDQQQQKLNYPYPDIQSQFTYGSQSISQDSHGSFASNSSHLQYPQQSNQVFQPQSYYIQQQPQSQQQSVITSPEEQYYYQQNFQNQYHPPLYANPSSYPELQNHNQQQEEQQEPKKGVENPYDNPNPVQQKYTPITTLNDLSKDPSEISSSNGKHSQSTASDMKHPIEIISSMAPQVNSSTNLKNQLNEQNNATTPFGNGSISSYSSKNSPFNDDNEQYQNLDVITNAFTSRNRSGNSLEISNPNTVRLIPHDSSPPQFDLKKYPEFFDETTPNAFARIFLLREVHNRLTLAAKDPNLYNGMLAQGLGKLASQLPELEGLFFKYRGLVMNDVRNGLSNLTDSNAETLLVLTSLLNSSSIYIKSIKIKDFFSLASGPSVLLKTGFENPDQYPKSFIKLKNHADGLLFTARSVWSPRYNHKSLYEFLEIIKEFGSQYIEDEDQYNHDDLIRVQYGQLISFIEYALEVLENYQSNEHVLCYPVDKIYRLVQLWYFTVPSNIYTFGSKTPAVEKVFYTFWFALGDLMEEILVGSRYVFGFLFNGFYLLFPFKKEHLYKGIEDQNILKYANYSCRIIAFLNRRKAYIVRNTVLNDPIPAYFDTNDRFKPRALDIHERCITSFKNTIIKPHNYPSEAATSGNLKSDVNYYKTQDKDEDSTSTLFDDFNTSLGNDESDSYDEVDHLDVNVKTGLLNKDFDPRFTDPIFQSNVVFQNADLNFLNKYHEDRKLVIQLDIKD